MKTLFERLSDEQNTIVHAMEPTAVIDGVVGSGKTDTLVAKMLHLIFEKGVPGEKIVCVSFNHGTAKIIRERFRRYAPHDMPKEKMPVILAFYQWCADFVRKNTPLATDGLNYFSVADSDEFKHFYPERQNDPHPPEPLPFELEEWKKWRHTKGLSAEFREFQRNENTFFYESLSPLARQVLHSNQLVANPEWLFIDELQDLKQNDLEFVESLHARGARLVAFGDPNQSIFSWAKALGKEAFAVFKRDLNAKEFRLTRNYRSSKTIVEAAGGFMKHSNMIVADRSDACSKIVLNRNISGSVLTEKLREIEKLVGTRIGQREIRLSDIAILVRSNADRETVINTLRSIHFDYPVYGFGNSDKTSTMKWLLYLLLAATNHRNTYAMCYALTHSLFGPRRSTKDALEMIDGVLPSDGMIKKIIDFRSECDRFPLDGLTNAIEDYFKLADCISSNINQDKRVEYLESFRLMLNDLEKYCRDVSSGNLFSGILAYLDLCQLDREHLSNIVESSRDALRVMTIHASHGQEFTFVWIWGDFFPFRWNGETFIPDEEQFNVFFVALTRASEGITILASDRSKARNAQESRFVDHIRRDLCQENSLATFYRREATMSKETEIAYLGKQCRRNPPRGVGKVVSEDKEKIVVLFENGEEVPIKRERAVKENWI